MGLKRMVTKLAMAFAAKKGMEMFRNAGGIHGVRSALSGQTQQAGMDGRVGGARQASAQGLGNLLGSLGIAGASDGREHGATGQIAPHNASLGTLLGALSRRFNGETADSGSGAGIPAAEILHDDTDPMDQATARAIVRAMVHTARADGHIDAQEQEALHDILEEEGQTARSILREAMDENIDAQAVANDTPMSARLDVYTAARLVASDPNPAEETYLRELARALDLDADETSLIGSSLNLRGIAA